MTALISMHNSALGKLDHASNWLTPTVARLTFIAVLLVYYWNSAMTKLGSGFFGFLFPSDGAYVQIFPKAMEAVGYDSSQLGFFTWPVAVAGTWAEFILPALLLVGLLTRLAALGMIGFVWVQTFTDVTGHGVKLGGLFDNTITLMDQRVMWTFLFVVIVINGAGPLSLDRVLRLK
ncbi:MULTISPECIES: DoxX family membrane protein [Ruegeria]|uniref:DoxX family membrane protein n=1 Tax=Ruegeria TaxID=97050 RepID=UPI00147FC893|nr:MULTISPECIES: DoxX family membrane protein [Ruegeria]MBY6081717.1 DoxX family membrane protein [Ruegeria arenilitoris]UWR06195.1 DoxX family membrane protein [Ruegeria sp. B32]